MPANIEIKARVRNFADSRKRAEQLSDSPLEILSQEDTFFHISHGRLKLRLLGADRGQLIHYERPDQNGPKRSDFRIYETQNPQALKTVLTSALGVRGVVKKTRYLYLVGQTRIHLDQVDGLGQFLELEVMLHPGQSDEEGQGIAEDLMSKLVVTKDDLLEGAYMDLIEGQALHP